MINGQQTTNTYIDTSLKCDTTYRWNMNAFNYPSKEGPTTPAHPARMYFTVACEPKPADLVIAYNGITFNPNPPVEGSNVDVTCQYSNSPSGGTANSGFDVKVTIDGSPKSTTGSALSPGSSDSRTFTFGSYPQGPHTVACEVNTNRVVTESNYDNSGWTTTKTWNSPPAPAGQADLVINGITFSPDPPVSGQNVDVTCKYANGGNAGTGNSFDVKITVDSDVKSTTASALGANQADQRTITFGSKSTGSHTIRCDVNTNRAVTERNYDNSGWTTTKTWSSPPTTPSENHPPHTPSSPTPLHGTSSVALDTHLSWTGGDPDAGDEITYNVFLGVQGTAMSVRCSGTHSTTCPNSNLGDLQAATTYAWRVDARDRHGEVTSGIPWSFTTAADNAPAPEPSDSLPGPVRNLGGDGDTLQNYLGWQAPSSDGGSAITNYRVYRGASSDSQALVTSGGCANLRVIFACTDTGLNAGQTYHYTVRAANSAGQGPAGSLISVTTNPADDVPADLVINSITVSPASPEPGQAFTVKCTFSNGGGTSASGFDVKLTIDGANQQTTTYGTLSTGGRDSHTFTYANGLPEGTHRAVCSVNDNRVVMESNIINDNAPKTFTVNAQPVASEPVEPSTEIPVPILRAEPGPGQHEITLTWEVPQGHPSSEITGYRLSWERQPWGDGESRPLPLITYDLGKTQSYVHSGLRGLGPGYYRISAVTVEGEGSLSNLASAIPPSYTPSGTGYFFIHGICSTDAMWIQDNRHGYAVWNVLTSSGYLPYWAETYGGDGSLDQSPSMMMQSLKEELEDFIDGWAGSEGWKSGSEDGFGPKPLAHALSKVVIVGHSNGGLMARWLYAEMLNDPKYADRIERVVTIDSPDLGGDKSSLEYWGLKKSGCDSAWVDYTEKYLDRDGSPGTGWIYENVAPAMNQRSVIRFVFGECERTFTGSRGDSYEIDPTCSINNVAVGKHDANANGAILLAHAPDAIDQKKAALAACQFGSTGFGNGAFSAVAIRTLAQKPDYGPRDIYHSWGIEYYATIIAATARDGIPRFYGSHDEYTTTFECSVLNKIGEVSTIDIAGVITLSSATQAEPFASGTNTGSLRASTSQTQAYQPGFTMEAEPSDNKLSLLRVKVNSPTSPGKIVVVNADENLWKSGTKIGVWLDNKPVEEADDYQTLTSDTSTTSAAKYLLVKGAAGHQFLVWVPHFSERTIEIAAIEDAGQAFVTPLGIAAMAAGAILVAATAYGIGRRRERFNSQSTSSPPVTDSRPSSPNRDEYLATSATAQMQRPLLAWSFVLAIPALVYWAVAMDLRFSGSPVEDDVRMWVAKQSQRLGAFEELAVGVAVAVPVAMLLSHFTARRHGDISGISEAIEAEIRPEPDLLPSESDRVVDFGGQLESHAPEAPHPEPNDTGQVLAKVDTSPKSHPAEHSIDHPQAPLVDASESGEGDAQDEGEDSIESSSERDSEKPVEEMAVAGDGWLEVEGNEPSHAEESSVGGEESVDEEKVDHAEAVDEDGWEIIQDDSHSSPSGGLKR